MSVDIRVRGYHLDIYQHVNNGRYLEFLEEARWDFIGNTGFDKAAQALGVAFVIVNININYRIPAVVNDLLRVDVKVGRIGNKSCQFEQKIMKVVDGIETDLIVDAVNTVCFMDLKTGKSVPIEGELLRILEEAQHT